MKPNLCLVCLLLPLLPLVGCKTQQSAEARPSLEGHGGGINALAFSPNSKILASASDDATIRLWDLKQRKELAVLKGHDKIVLSLAFAPDGKTLASGSCDHSLVLWDVATHKSLAVLRHPSWVRCVAFSPDAKTVASGSVDETVRLWETATGKQRAVFRMASRAVGGDTSKRAVDAVAFSPDGRTLAAAEHGEEVKLWDLVNEKELTTLKGSHGNVGGLAFTSDGKLLASLGDSEVILWDVRTGQKRATLGCRDVVFSLAISPKDDILAVGLHDRVIRLWDLKSRRELMTVGNHTSYVGALAFSPDGEMLASANGGLRFADQGRPGEIWLWNLKEVRPKRD